MWICGINIYIYTPLYTLRFLIFLARAPMRETPHSIATPNTPIATTIALPSAFVTAAPVGVLVLTPVSSPPCVTVTVCPPAPAVVMLPDVPASAALVCCAPDGNGVVAFASCYLLACFPSPSIHPPSPGWSNSQQAHNTRLPHKPTHPYNTPAHPANNTPQTSDKNSTSSCTPYSSPARHYSPHYSPNKLSPPPPHGPSRWACGSPSRAAQDCQTAPFFRARTGSKSSMWQYNTLYSRQSGTHLGWIYLGWGRRAHTSIRATLLPLAGRETVVFRADHVAVAIALVACAVDCASRASGEEAAMGVVAGLELCQDY